MNIGILFPRSNTYPLIGADFAEGLKTFLQKEGLDKHITINTESVGFGGAEKEVYAKAEKLLMIDGVDLLIGFIDEKMLELIKPVILASGKLFILVNPGANHPLNWVPQPNIITLSLQHSFLCAMTGFKAAISNGVQRNAQAAVASTFYDCGYLHLAAMVNEFQASGGTIRHNYINNQVYTEPFNIGQLTDFLNSNTDVNSLLCVFDSVPASLFFQQLNIFENADRLNLSVSPMMLEKKALENIGNGFRFPLSGYLPWHPSVPHEGNRLFTEHYSNSLKKEPSIFSVPGWEAGIIIKTILGKAGNNFSSGEELVNTLKNEPITGPRGLLQLDAGTQHFLSPAIRCHIAAGSAAIEMEYDMNLENEWEEFSAKQTEGHVSGWTNTYLCY